MLTLAALHSMAPGTTFTHSQEWVARAGGCLCVGSVCGGLQFQGSFGACKPYGRKQRPALWWNTWPGGWQPHCSSEGNQCSLNVVKKKASAALFLPFWMWKYHFHKSVTVTMSNSFLLLNQACRHFSWESILQQLLACYGTRGMVGKLYWESNTAFWRDGWARYQDESTGDPAAAKLLLLFLFIGFFFFFIWVTK